MLLIVILRVAHDSRAGLNPRVPAVLIEYSVIMSQHLTFLDYWNIKLYLNLIETSAQMQLTIFMAFSQFNSVLAMTEIIQTLAN